MTGSQCSHYMSKRCRGKSHFFHHQISRLLQVCLAPNDLFSYINFFLNTFMFELAHVSCTSIIIFAHCLIVFSLQSICSIFFANICTKFLDTLLFLTNFFSSALTWMSCTTVHLKGLALTGI